MFISRKKAIFFDGDGTIWYPRSTRRTKAPYWVYGNTKDSDPHNPGLKHLILTRTAIVTLKKLKRLGVRIFLLSTHPHPPKIADVVLKRKLKHLKIPDIFDESLATGADPAGKGKAIVRLLKKYRLPKRAGLMVGDSYKYDYRSAKAVGVDAVLLFSDYLKHPSRGPRVSRLIEEVGDVLKFV